MQERKTYTLLKAGLIIVNIPYVAGNRAGSQINQHISDAHTKAVLAQRSGICDAIRAFLKGYFAKLLIGNQLDLVTEGVLQQASDIQRKKGNP